jgi:uncharacterized protein involved in response to NO
MTAIPRYRSYDGPVIFSAGFRPFFLLAALWAAISVPLWLLIFAGEVQLASALLPSVWHVHEMVFGYGAAVVAGFLLTSIPNWTGRMPLQGRPLATLVALWIAGRVAVLVSTQIGAVSAAILDLAFPVLFLAAVAREIVAGRNWRNLPMLGALTALLAGNCLIHLEAIGISGTANIGNRIGVATLLMLISFVGGRIVPSFTRNWLARERPEIAAPAPFDTIDRIVLGLVAVTLLVWLLARESSVAPWTELVGGLAVAVRLARWRGRATLREPLLWVLHLGYGWLSLGFLLLAFNGFRPVMPETTALHALTVGAIGTMTLAVITRASLGHTGRPLAAGKATTAIYALVTMAAAARLLAPLTEDHYLAMLAMSGAAWSSAYALFVLTYASALMRPMAKRDSTRPI